MDNELRPGWVILFADFDRRPEIFTDDTAEQVVYKRYNDLKRTWTCHLYKSADIDDDSKILAQQLLRAKETLHPDSQLRELLDQAAAKLDVVIKENSQL